MNFKENQTQRIEEEEEENVWDQNLQKKKQKPELNRIKIKYQKPKVIDFTKKNKDKKKKGRSADYEYQQSSIMNNPAVAAYFNKYTTMEKLEYENWPLIIWLIGTIMTILAFVLCYKLLSNNRGSGFWQYLIMLFLLGLGIAFLLSGQIQRVTFDKRHQKLLVEQINIICQRKCEERKLKQITKVELKKEGDENLWNNTIHFNIEVQFGKDQSLIILESPSERKTRSKLLEIQTFIHAKLKPGILDLDDEGFEFTQI